MSFKQLNNTAKQRALAILQHHFEDEGLYPTQEELEEMAQAYKFLVNGVPISYA